MIKLIEYFYKLFWMHFATLMFLIKEYTHTNEEKIYNLHCFGNWPGLSGVLPN